MVEHSSEGIIAVQPGQEILKHLFLLTYGMDYAKEWKIASSSRQHRIARAESNLRSKHAREPQRLIPLDFGKRSNRQAGTERDR